MKIPKARQLPSGSWRCEVYKKGVRKSFVKDTEDEAVKAAMLFRLSDDSSSDALSYKQKNLTLAEAIDSYVESRGSILSPATIRGYDQIKRLRFQRVMDEPIAVSHDWQTLVNEEAEKGLSGKTIANAWGLVASVLRAYKVPVTTPTMPQIIRNEMAFLQPEQIRIFLDAIHGDRFEIAYLLCLHSLRRSEMMAMTKKNIRDGKIFVEGSKVQNKDGKFVTKKTNKNSASKREIPIFIKRLSVLVESAPDGVLVPHAAGNMFSHLQVISKNNGLPPLGFHSLRHSFASLCYHLKISELGCQQLGGWDDPTTMRKIYTHLAEIDKKNAEIMLKEFFD